nr:serine/threonine-protein phosphatase 1 regulatory subunit 10 [Bactrocera oleae]XP_014103245.2 serine/threonine-protein phosphatase 1 regulatory subunit 10 [Bactrocera oleae]XP_014103246.2 serine/threonine-protein phosphatase 1 regulatory subunit 10 [Bactrocera oleae]XP_036214562.1 serine/threonine-protein phosphatase 1 regulatory subunit 10 [Bactrocera oleae]XP_036214563.1 serine/threonine-protein phosphatase 1 regulatory subunit 10 [Bactrocera oleae]XP_036214564.1 serine/threonine-protein 
MPRIVPLQLLKCLKVLLDDNGGILSIGEVKRIAGLMNRYSKKLVSKCIYVQILKVTKTELLGEFMGVGGWSLVYNWLNDAIRAMNWPLVQEILELLLLCPVDVDRLKINSAPKLVKGLCRDGGNEGVRILAKRLVEQWLKVVTENTTTAQVESSPQQSVIGAATPNVSTIPAIQTTPAIRQDSKIPQTSSIPLKVKGPAVVQRSLSNSAEQDPLADVTDVPPEPSTYAPTPAQKKASEAGLVFKLVYKDGQQVLTQVPKTNQLGSSAVDVEQNVQRKENEDDCKTMDHDGNMNGDTEAEGGTAAQEEEENDRTADSTIIEEEDDTRTSTDKQDKDSESSADEESQTTSNSNMLSLEQSATIRKKSIDTESEKSISREHRSSKDSRDSKNRDKENKSDKDKDRKSSSSSTHKSSSHKSKSSSSSKSKSSSSSSSRRSSSDKHRSDKDRSSSSKDKDRKEGSSSSSSSSKHRSSSSTSKSSSSTSSKDKHRDKDKDKSANTSSSSHKKEKEREKETPSDKDKESNSKLLSTSDKLGRIPKKHKDESETDVTKPTSITIPSKKASMSIEIRRDSEKAKTVKTYKSQFRSHGLTEEAPPPPSRKGLKKPVSSVSAPGTVIPTSLPSSLKRPSPPPSSSDSPTQKKSKIDINNLTVANEKPGAIKLIAPKKIQTLVETNIFSDALSAATGPKKVAKRKRPTTPGPGQNKEGPSPPTSPDAPKVAPLKFYQDTLDESKSEDKSDKENDSKDNNNKSEDLDSADKGNSTEDDDDIPLKKVKEDIEQKVLREQKTGDDSSDAAVTKTGGSVDITGSDGEEDVATKSSEEDAPKPPGPGCGPNGPPGVLMLHRRKGPKKKLTWRPQDQLEQIRYFELDETERVNVTKAQSFMDMKNLERFSERDAINIARRGFTHEDNMRPLTEWRPLIEVDGVPPHPNGNQSKQRKVQAEREMTTLRALYFSHSMIPDSPAEAELEPHFAVDIPVIPLEDITGNPDAVSDYTNMPWPEPKTSPKSTENILPTIGNLPTAQVNTLPPNNLNTYPGFMPQYAGVATNNLLATQMQMPRPVPTPAAASGPHPAWQTGNFNGNLAMGPLAGGPPVQPQNMLGPFGPGAGNPQWQLHGGNQYGPAQGPFNNAPNFGPMGLLPPRVMPNMAPANLFERNNMNHHNNNNQNRNNGGNWRTGSNFQDNNGGGNWRSGGGGGGQNRGGGGGGGNSNNGVCKAFMRGHCRLGKSCKFIHPKSKRI